MRYIISVKLPTHYITHSDHSSLYAKETTNTFHPHPHMYIFYTHAHATNQITFRPFSWNLRHARVSRRPLAYYLWRKKRHFHSLNGIYLTLFPLFRQLHLVWGYFILIRSYKINGKLIIKGFVDMPIENMVIKKYTFPCIYCTYMKK